MCTLIVLHRCVAGSPLVVVANRDEFLDRPAEGLAIRSRPGGSILSPLDLEAGGTWLGLNERGVFVGLTNLRPTALEDSAASERVSSSGHSSASSGGSILSHGATLAIPGALSRGEVVMAALDAGSAEVAVARITEMTQREGVAYNPFQLLIADAERAWLTVHRGKAKTFALEAGVHVVGNVESNFGEAPPSGKLTRIQERVEKIIALRDAKKDPKKGAKQVAKRDAKRVAQGNEGLFEDLAEICREHVEGEPFESTCVHIENRYGTRSSFLLELQGPDADQRGLRGSREEQENAEQEGKKTGTTAGFPRGRLWTSEGAPCETPYVDRSDLLVALSTGGSRPDGRHETSTIL